ncbi:hypothetical protein AB0M34_25630 [Nocardia sp. NPDC050193]
MQPHPCRECGNRVLVEKNSLAHTSIQWTGGLRYVEFAAAPDLTSRALRPTCAKMRDSIECAVREGLIDIGSDQR